MARDEYPEIRDLDRLSPGERADFCREVFERFSELIDGEAPADFCARVEAVFGDCRPYVAFRNTLEATVRETRACRDVADLDDERFRACVERVRDRLAIS